MALSVGSVGAAPPIQPSVDDTLPQPQAKATGVKALADKFLTSGTAFSPNAAIAATASSAIANATVREAVTSAHIEGAYLGNMINNFTGNMGYGGYGAYGTMSRSTARALGRSYGSYGTMATNARYGTMATNSRYGVMGGGMFSPGGAFANGSEAFSRGIQAMKSGLKAQVGIGAAVGAVMSLVTNISGVAKGEITKADAAGNVATDTVSSGISAAGGAILGGVATAVLGAVGIAGLPLTLLGIGAGVLGGVVTDGWFRKSKLASGIHDMVAQAFAK